MALALAARPKVLTTSATGKGWSIGKWPPVRRIGHDIVVERQQFLLETLGVRWSIESNPLESRVADNCSRKSTKGRIQCHEVSSLNHVKNKRKGDAKRSATNAPGNLLGLSCQPS